YFDDIGLWYSDTFPCRDDFVSINGIMRSTFGLSSIEIYGDVENAEEVPDKEIDEPKQTTTKENASSQKTESKQNKEPKEKPKDETKEQPKDKKEEKPKEETNEKPKEETKAKPAKNVVIEKLGAIAIIENAGYEYYNFDKEVANNYVAAISLAADKLKGKARVFNTVVPTSIGVTLSDDIAAKLNSSDQKKAINYISSNMGDKVISVDSYSVLRQHKDEYLYFRTDHHWTANAAYYSYTELMKAAGKSPAELSQFKERVFKGFLGTFYTSSKQSPKLAKKPDVIYAYEPPGLEYIHAFTKDYTKDFHIVSNVDSLDASEKYLTFLCGDYPLGVITNKEIKDDSACLIIKESFGNAIAAFFTQNYNKVYVADCRMIKDVFKGNLKKFVGKYKINDVYFINNISATRSAPLVDKISEFVK
ncbi:MAG: hypothetical protein J5852_04130, partial [Clostridia bacterium]|nr:hypothetical protein [Clostridia bacterium]